MSMWCRRATNVYWMLWRYTSLCGVVVLQMSIGCRGGTSVLCGVVGLQMSIGCRGGTSVYVVS